jgi:thiosulfate/3-mercaptopyruvate sulfurtransferase
MRACRLVLLSLAFVPLAIAPVPAASPRDSLVVSTTWLAQHLNDANLVLLHLGSKQEYDTAHIPGARFVTLSDVSVSDMTGKGLTLEMPPVDDLRERLMKIGVSDSSRIVVYSGTNSVSATTRVIFTLDYAGLGDRTSMLDGGMGAWTRDQHAVTAVVPAAKMGTLAPLNTKPLIVDAEYVLAHLKTPNVSIVDARTAAFYDGVQTGGSKDTPHKTGHIAGATSIPYTEITDTSFALRSPEELTALFAKAGVKPGDTVVGYCHIGQQATAMLFAARTLGYRVLLYDGAFEDWSRHADYPVEITIKKRPVGVISGVDERLWFRRYAKTRNTKEERTYGNESGS